MSWIISFLLNTDISLCIWMKPIHPHFIFFWNFLALDLHFLGTSWPRCIHQNGNNTVVSSIVWIFKCSHLIKKIMCSHSNFLWTILRQIWPLCHCSKMYIDAFLIIHIYVSQFDQIQSCSARAKNFIIYVFCHPQFSGVTQNIENHCAIFTPVCLCQLLSKWSMFRVKIDFF